MTSDTRRPRPAPEVRGRDTGDEYLFYDDAGDMHILNGTAREIYLLCDGTRSLEEIADAFAETYSISVEQARADVDDVVNRLSALHVLVDAPVN